MKHHIEYIALIALRKFLIHNPDLIPPLSQKFWKLFMSLKIREGIARANLQAAGFDSSQILPELYTNTTKTFLEFLTLEHFNAQISISQDFDFKNLSGGIILSAHIGNWEFLGKYLAGRIHLTVVVKRQANPFTDRLINSIRKKCRMEIVYEDDIYGILRAIRNQRWLALLADQDFGQNTIPVNFFNRKCMAPSGPERLARKFNLPIVIVLNRRTENGFEFYFEKLKAGENPLQQFTDLLEQFIRPNPSEWLWFHNRWK